VSATDQRLIAIHDAAHAVLAVRFDLFVEEMLIRRYAATSGCSELTRRLNSMGEIPSRTTAMLEIAAIHLAGPAAELMMIGVQDAGRCDWDREQAKSLGSRQIATEPAQPLFIPRNCDVFLSNAERISRALVSAYWSAILCVADELLARDRLPGARVREIFADGINEKRGLG
jgi:hypothetical protein